MDQTVKTEPAVAEGHQRFVLSVQSSHSALDLLTVPHFHLRQRQVRGQDKREELRMLRQYEGGDILL